MFLHVMDVRYCGDYRLRLEFSDGTIKEVDLQNELLGEVFAPLHDLNLFGEVRVNPETRTIEWPNGADFAPEFLHAIGKDIAAPAAREAAPAPIS